jgi:hypothetical protein
MINQRRLIIRSALVAVWILLGAVLFVFFRGHPMLLDNRNIQDLDIRAPDLINVSIDGGPFLEFFRGDRDRYRLSGSNHRIYVEFSDGTPPFAGTFVLPLKDDMYLLSVPKMMRGIEPYVEVFHTTPEPREAVEEDLPSEDDEFFIRAEGVYP